MNVETAVCLNQSPSPPLQFHRVDSQSSEPQRDIRDIDRYKEMKKKRHTQIEKRCGYREGFFFSQASKFCTNQTKMCAFNLSLTAKEKQPPLIASGIETRFTRKK